MNSGATLVDTNVLLDIATDDATWATWSAAALESAFESGRILINPIVYAELSVRFPSIESLDHALPEKWLRREQLPWSAAFLAGKAYVEYQRRGGTRISPLPDFYIGAHAAVAGHRLLTRDARRYRTYFPRVELISPSE